MSILKKQHIKLASEKKEQNKISCISLEKILDLSSMRMRQVDKKEQKGAKFKDSFPFLKTKYFKVINIIKND